MIRYILITLAVGAFAGYLNSNYGDISANTWVSGYMFDLSLLTLLFLMGFVFGCDKEASSKLKKAGLKILVVPLAIALGSMLGGLAGGHLLGLNIVGSMAVSSGYGWYTLAGPMVGQLFGAQFGALGFVVNFLRELVTMASISLTSRVDKYTPVAFGGATTMDTTLPVIARYCGPEALITAFSSGFILSTLAPFAITGIAAIPS